MLRSVVMLCLTFSAAAAAQCNPPNDCRCGLAPDWAAVVRTNADAGATIETLNRLAGSDAGPTAADLAAITGVDGVRFVLTPYVENASKRSSSEAVMPIAPEGTVQCQPAAAKFEAVAWTRALTDRTCGALLTRAGAVQTPCRDVAPRCGCSAGGVALPFAALLLVLPRRRGRDGRAP